MHFDPTVFADDHPEMTLEANRVDDSELKGWGDRCSEIRKQFSKQAS